MKIKECKEFTYYIDHQSTSKKMHFRRFSRFFHLTRQNLFASETSSLALLRKKTGYTFANCKKALQANENDVVKVDMRYLQREINVHQ